jgi:hypothetical protein
MMIIIIITLSRFSAAKKHDAKDEVSFQDEKPATRLDCERTQELELTTSKMETISRN